MIHSHKKVLAYYYIIFFLIFCFVFNRGFTQTTGWSTVSAILSNINPPTFQNVDFDITNYGAVGDGTTDCTYAFASAIESCSTTGGGSVVVPLGNFLTGPIVLENNVNLYLSSGATIQFTTDSSKYLPVVLVSWEGSLCYNYQPLLSARSAANIAITGPGTIDGQATLANWQGWQALQSPDQTNLRSQNHSQVPVNQRIYGTGHYLRPGLIEFYNCQNILLDGFTVKNSPFWTVHPVFCNNITAKNLTILGSLYNTDGFNPESCTYVLATSLTISDGDDSIAIKAGRDNDGWSFYTTSEFIVIENCTCKASVGGITIGSEMSAGVHNVYAENCVISTSTGGLANGIFFKSNPNRGGFIKDIYVRNITEYNVKSAIYITGQYGTWSSSYYPQLYNLNVEELSCTQASQAGIYLLGSSFANPIDTINLQNISITTAQSPLAQNNVLHFTFTNVSVNGAPVQGGNSSFWSPSNPTSGQILSIYYNPIPGTLADTTNPVYIHLGYNYWSVILSPDTVMSFDSSTGYWRYDYTIPSIATTVDFNFTDGNGNIDNNNSQDWHIPVFADTVDISDFAAYGNKPD